MFRSYFFQNFAYISIYFSKFPYGNSTAWRRQPKRSSSHTGPCERVCVCAVTQLNWRVHADLQPDLHDAAGGPLVGLPPVPGAHAAGLPARLLGRHQ